jgi:hypothetical protein
MKFKLSLLLLGIFASQLLQAQKWCPPGATWYFQEGYPYWVTDSSQMQIAIGYDKASYSKDTLITSQACKVITDTSYYEDFTHIRVNGSIYTYASGDTVYLLYNNIFTPIFYFNCHTGDTLWVPWANTIVATYVDSTGVMIINGDSLRFYNYRAIDSPYNCIHTVGGTSNGQIVERLGNSVGPANNSFSFDFSCNEWEGEYFLHCYRDDSFALYSTDSVNGCTYIQTGIKGIGSPVQLALSPNPASSNCRLQLNDDGRPYTAAVFDMSGREILPLFTGQHVSNFDFNTAALSAGLYFVKVVDEAGNFAVAKLMKE